MLHSCRTIGDFLRTLQRGRKWFDLSTIVCKVYGQCLYVQDACVSWFNEDLYIQTYDMFALSLCWTLSCPSSEPTSVYYPLICSVTLYLGPTRDNYVILACCRHLVKLLVGSYHSSYTLHVAELGGLPRPLRLTIRTPFTGCV